MTAYSGKSKRIKNALLALLTAVTYDTGNGAEAAFVQVLDSTYNSFDGYPNAQVLPGHEAISRPTVAQADKAPDYIVRVRIPLEDTAQSRSAAFDQMYDLSDLVIDAITQADQDNSLDDGNGPLGTYMMEISQGDWLELPSNNGLNLTFDLNVSVSYSHDLH